MPPAPPPWETFLDTVVDPLNRDRWARLRFLIIGPLLAAPPNAGDLHAAFIGLTARSWRHPSTGRDVCFGVSTLERWYYTARAASDPVAALRNRLRGDIGRFPSLSPRAIEVLTLQYREHPGWTAQLHFDNLRVALTGSDAPLASYPTIRRYLKAQGMFRQASPKRATLGAVLAETGSSNWKSGVSSRPRFGPLASRFPSCIAQGAHAYRGVDQADAARCN